MKEDFLHYVWKHQVFDKKSLTTTKKGLVEIVNAGIHNFNSGPDFLNGKIVLDAILWAGNIEIHVKSSDWYLHKHEEDKNYDSVILHVVWEDDVEVFDKNNQAIPTIELSNLVSKELLQSYQDLSSKKVRWIPCEQSIASVASFVFENWKTRLYFERLEEKSVLIQQLLTDSNNNYEAVLFQLLMKNFGLKSNGNAFLNLANSIDFSIVRKEQHDNLMLNALLFGQAGFLEEEIEEEYFIQLKKEYAYLSHKHQLQHIDKNQFLFFRMRPSNFPTIRIAQIAALYHNYQQLFSKLMQFTRLEDFYKLFTIEVDAFWKTHYTFQKVSPPRRKRITKAFVDLLLINTIIPLKFNYLKQSGEVDEAMFLEVLKQIHPEKNAIISKFSELQISSKNAFDTQALLQLKNNYCTKKQCLRCVVGNSILRKI